MQHDADDHIDVTDKRGGQPYRASFSVEEQVLFHGTPSQWINFNQYFRNFLIVVTAIGAPSFWNNFIEPFFDADDVRYYYMFFFKGLFIIAPVQAFWLWLETYFHRYTVTTERFSEGVGVFSRNTEELELYRVKDITMREPFALRMFGLSEIVLSTSDRSTPYAVIHGVANGRELLNMIRRHVEIMRARKGVREID